MRPFKPMTWMLALGALCTCLSALAADDMAGLLDELSGKAPAHERSANQLRTAYEKAVDYLVPLMAADDVESRYEPQNLFSYIAAHAARPGAADERAALCEVLAKRVTGNTPEPARAWILRQLALIGGEESVGALAACLKDSDGHIRELARRALETNSSPKADAVLLDALGTAVNPAWRIGVINALGTRRVQAAAGPCMQELSAQDPAIAEAAAMALAQIGGNSAIDALLAERRKAEGPREAMLTKALMDAGLAASRNEDDRNAMRVFTTLINPGNEPSVRAAALGGLAAAAPARAVLEARTAMNAGLPELECAVIQCAHLLNDKGLARSLALKMPELSPERQVQVLGLLADVGGKETQNEVLAMLGSDNVAVRVAAIGALGRLANRASAEGLVKAAGQGQAEKQAAMLVLATLESKDVSNFLSRAATQGNVDARAIAVEAITARNDTGAVKQLLQLTKDKEAPIAQAAIAGLGALGGDSEMPALVDALLHTEDAGIRSAAQKALAAVCRRSENPGAAAAQIGTNLASVNTDGQRAGLEFLRFLGNNDSLPLLIDAAKSRNADLSDAGIRALCDWPSYAAVPALLDIAKQAKEEKYNVLALRGIVRLAGNEKAEKQERRLEDLKSALAVAGRAEERSLIAVTLAGIPQPAAAEILLGQIADQETAQAALALADKLKDKSPELAQKLKETAKAALEKNK